MSKFKVGDRVWHIMSGDEYTVSQVNGKQIFLEGQRGLYSEDAFAAVESAPTIQAYSDEELSEIEELRDRVDYLESLCSDYAKIISEKNDRIESLEEVNSELSSNTYDNEVWFSKE